MDPASLSADELSQLIGLIYEGPLEPVPWQKSLNFIRERLRANYVTLILRSSTPDDPGLYISAGDVTTEGSVSYATYYYSLDPFVDLPPEQVVTVHEILGEAQWIASPLYQEFLAHYNVFHIMGADVRTPGGEECRLRVCRPREAEAFSENDKAFCRLLLPHLKRAMILHAHFDRSESERKLYAGAMDRLMVGTLILDENGKILQTNAPADELLQARDGLRLADNALAAVYPRDDRELQRLVKGALCGHAKPGRAVVEAMSVMRPSGKRNLGVVVRSVPMGEWSEGKRRPAVAVFVRDPDSQPQATHEVVRQMFGLTPAEAALAMELAKGLSLEEAAVALNVRTNTVRAHLRSIFSKTGVARQSELVRVLLNSVAALACKKT
ncbi:helix-turn-helix transcriptional regulator [Pandoraea terrae]|uniref:Helix-turn-helix transcriptional regulator n=1 Tax=Pandoraea terrae TaxID=1537710 RepID=A0A5E4SA63_9BURK|nr:LuxR C-terminal-related transcriptional regulator [Pandoraea terrae]VVD72490.1 helix-turn-helix transcriptional regulator [Pandoraea terrae]